MLLKSEAQHAFFIPSYFFPLLTGAMRQCKKEPTPRLTPGLRQAHVADYVSGHKPFQSVQGETAAEVQCLPQSGHIQYPKIWSSDWCGSGWLLVPERHASWIGFVYLGDIWITQTQPQINRRRPSHCCHCCYLVTYPICMCACMCITLP